MKKKIAAVWLSLAMIFGLIVIIVEIAPVVKGSSTIYVDDVPGSGPGNPAENYTRIQDAIDNANTGDTVFVYNGTYYEHVVINKTINLTGENRNTTIIDGGGSGDVVYVSANNVNITEFTVTGSGSNFNPRDAGIELYNAQDCKAIHNYVSNNNYGILLLNSQSNDIIDNNASINYHGILFSYSNNSKIRGNFAYKNKYGIYLSESYMNNVSYNTASYNDIHGIVIASSSNNDIIYNDAYFNDGHGIYSDYSSGNNLSYNNVSNNRFGINLEYIGYSNVTGNIISSNRFYGISLGGTYYNILKENILKKNGIYVFGSQIDQWNTHTIDTSNIVNNKPVYYLKNQNGGIVPSGAGQVILANCTNILIENQELTDCSIGIGIGFSSNNSIKSNSILLNSRFGINLYDSSWNRIVNNNILFGKSVGIRLWYSSFNTISNNNISSNNSTGMELESSYENNITQNNISENWRGIKLSWDFYDNQIYHNNFINNLNRAIDSSNNGNQWDNGYPLGGNYWSDYSGVDNFKGPYQNIPGSDGIGDINYSIDSDSLDNYPLMGPYPNFPTENYTILKQGWNLISIPLIQSESTISKVLRTIDGLYDAVQFYDITDTVGSWKHYKEGKLFGNDLFELNEAMGFWIHITQPGDTIFRYNGTHPTENLTITLHKGWNLVGYPSLTSYNRIEGLNNLTFGLQIDSIWTYYASTQKWKELGPTDYFEHGRGYWIHANNECEWEVPM
ncbi:MAG: right-handed parallel beta-helix repeat-containing protein [Thermoplasmata archaeon]|nr:MAG: right-handed parallel beta-helix repeat-containing protein [Thermoplasmata archaeon]